MGMEHLTRKIYKLREIPAWYLRVRSDWEKKFSPEVLEYGRKIYKISAITELELSGDEAIVCTKMEDSTSPYCVIDFTDDNKEFSVRGSVDDEFITNSVAVAGFYEIEELVGNEFTNGDISEVEDFESLIQRASVTDTEVQEESQTDEIFEETEKEEEASRILLLEFESRRSGLELSVYWKTKESSRKRRAFGNGCIPVESLTSAECENLIRLANFARKAGFKYATDSYILSDIAKIPDFLNTTLKRWESFFEIKKSANAQLLSTGEHYVELNPVAKSIDSGSADFDVEWSPCVAGKPIDLNEFQKLYSGDVSVKILPKYGIVRFSQSDISFVRNVENAREFGFGDGKIPRYMLLSLSDFGEKIKMSADLKKWADSILSQDYFDESKLPHFLRNYQKNGVAWAMKLFEHGCNSVIADEMGLGKTLQSLALIDLMKKRHSDTARFLVVCPASVIPVWKSETSKFFPELTCSIVDSKCEFSKGDILVSSYTQLRRNKSEIEKIEFELAILDEAQFIKNPDAKTTVACSSINAKHKLALTGTPIENRLLDLWTVFRWLMPGLMGTRKNFEMLSAKNVSSDLLATLKKQIAPFVLRRMKSDVAEELPEKIYVDLLCPLSDLQKSEYAKLLENARSQMQNMVDAKGRITILSLLTRLRQVACDAMLLPWVAESQSQDIGGKLTVLTDKIEELVLSGKKILVFSQFTKFLDLAKTSVLSRISNAKIFDIRGTTRDRAKPVEEFQKTRGSAVMFASLRAAGTGITLTTADYVFIADPWWNPAVEEQAIDRVHRIGRKSEVFVYRLIAQDTVEDRVRAMQKSKRKLFNELLGTLKDVSESGTFEQTIAEILK